MSEIKLNNQMILKIDHCNKNNRVYNLECAETMVETINGERPVLGTLGNPTEPPKMMAIDYNKVAFKVDDAVIGEDKVYATIHIMPTPQGNILKSILESGVDLVFRPCGVGNVTKDEGTGHNIVTDYKLLAVGAYPADQDSFAEEE